jgi:dihydroneopterin aldolase
VSYKISITNLTFETIIGILDYERENPQRVFVDFECSYRHKKDFVNYVDIRDKIKFLIIKNKYQLLEDAVDDIIKELQKEINQIFNLKIKITKPDILDDCFVSIEKKSN